MGTTVKLVRKTAAALTIAAAAMMLTVGSASAVIADPDYDGPLDTVVADTNADGAVDGS